VPPPAYSPSTSLSSGSITFCLNVQYNGNNRRGNMHLYRVA
jgi:hypothetical protein